MVVKRAPRMLYRLCQSAIFGSNLQYRFCMPAMLGENG